MKKLCNIVMLPTEVGVFYEIKTKPDYPKQTLYSELTFKCPYEDNALSVRFDRHLYITSDEEIKEGDNILYLIHQREPKTFDGLPIVTQYNPNIHLHKSDCKKIIATTDKSLHFIPREDKHKLDWMIPQISELFIKSFVETQGKIDKVYVEYEEGKRYKDIFDEDDKGVTINRLKLNSDNTIITSLFENETYKHLESVESLIETIQLVQAHLINTSKSELAEVLSDAVSEYRHLNPK